MADTDDNSIEQSSKIESITNENEIKDDQTVESKPQVDDDSSSINQQQQQQNVSVMSLSTEKKHDLQKQTYISDHFKQFFEPLITNLDENVQSLRTSQIDLSSQIDLLASQMKIINENLQKQIDLDDYTKRLLSTKKRVNNVLATILAVEERLNRIHSVIRKDQTLQQQQQQQQQQKQQSVEKPTEQTQ